MMLYWRSTNTTLTQIEYDGRTYYSLKKFGELCWYEGKHAHQVYDRTKLYFSNQALVEEKDGVLELAQVEANRSRGSKVYLTSIGLYIFVSKLELTKLSEDRQKFILAAVNYMAESADMRTKGELNHTRRSCHRVS
jgi:hypothetical protein